MGTAADELLAGLQIHAPNCVKKGLYVNETPMKNLITKVRKVGLVVCFQKGKGHCDGSFASLLRKERKGIRGNECGNRHLSLLVIEREADRA